MKVGRELWAGIFLGAFSFPVVIELVKFCPIFIDVKIEAGGY